MKKFITFILALTCVLALAGCEKQTITRTQTIKTDLKTYYELSDGSWECEGHTYSFRLEITGRMHNAAADSTFVYLSNQENITFDQAWKAAGLSSNMDDYFDAEDAVLVDLL